MRLSFKVILFNLFTFSRTYQGLEH